MSFAKVFVDKNSVDIATDKLIPFANFSFELFKGQRFTDMLENVQMLGIIKPIIVRPVADGKYEILNGHYRVAAAKELEFDVVPCIILEGLSDEQALLHVSETNPIGLLKRHGVDINDYDYYTKSEKFKSIENSRVFSDEVGHMALDEYIERFLLTKHEALDIYESIYDMGNPYELDAIECEYISLAREIVLNMNLADEIDEDDRGQVEKYDEGDFEARVEAKAEKLVASLTRKDGGYIKQLKKHLNMGLGSFDSSIISNRREKVKILYFLYMLKNKHFPGIEILELLSKPSMENIDNSFLGRETSNGRFIKLIIHSIEKELSLDGRRSKDNIKSAVVHVADTWGRFLLRTQLNMNFLENYGYDYGFCSIIGSLKSALDKPPALESVAIHKVSPLSPIETLYLKMLQLEHLGQVRDILEVHKLQTGVEYDVPPEFIEAMKKLELRKIKAVDMDAYFDVENVQKIAKFVWLKPETSKEERRKIRNSKEKVIRFLDFCSLAELYYSKEDEISELLIISCLQAIMLDEQNETFDYTFHGSQGKKGERKGKQRVQGALKDDRHTYEALQIYWVRKVIDRLNANIGRYDLKCQLRELEKVCLTILGRILECSQTDEMLAVNSLYYNAIEK